LAKNLDERVTELEAITKAQGFVNKQQTEMIEKLIQVLYKQVVGKENVYRVNGFSV
jgi:hypothetical protein